MSVSYKIANNTSTSGQVFSINGTTTANAYLSNGTAPWHQTSTGTWTMPNQTPVMTIPHGSNKVILDKGAALEVNGKLKLNGLDLEERLKTIERVLTIPERDAKLEKKYPKLKKMHDDYIMTLEKYRTFDRLKGE